MRFHTFRRSFGPFGFAQGRPFGFRFGYCEPFGFAGMGGRPFARRRTYLRWLRRYKAELEEELRDVEDELRELEREEERRAAAG